MPKIVSDERKKKLTPRQRQVLNELIKIESKKTKSMMMGAGARIHIIASELGIRSETVRGHLSRMSVIGVVQPYYSGYRVVTDKMLEIKQEHSELQSHLLKVSESFRSWSADESGFSLTVNFRDDLTKAEVLVIVDTVKERLEEYLLEKEEDHESQDPS